MYSRSNSGSNKIEKALNHVTNAERLIASLPGKYTKGEGEREMVRSIVRKLQGIADQIRTQWLEKNILQ